jgi:hypothetical protein
VRALLSVANCEGIGPFARDLLSLGVEVFATEGTREFLAGEGVEVRSVSELTGTEPIAGGQVKTLHPAIYAGILARRDRPDQLTELDEQGIGLIDLVAVNVSRFAPQVGARLVPIDEAIEMIDVGGAALRRNVRPRRRLPRRSGGIPLQRLRRHLPKPPGNGPREGGRPPLRREPQSAWRLLSRDDASSRHAG